MHWLIPLLVCALWSTPLHAAAQLAVSFQANATVNAPRVVLADIAQITPAGEAADQLGKLQVASAPAPGKTKELYVVTVINALRNRTEAAGVDWQGSQTITVQRGATVLDQQWMRQVIGEYLAENSARLPASEIRLTSFRAPEKIVLPAGKLSWKVVPSRPEIISSSSFSIVVAVDGKHATTCVVRGRLEAIAEVVTAAVPLQKGDVLSETHLARQARDIVGLANPFTSTGPLIGMQVARSINAGTILEPDHIVSVPVIRNGETVKIFARKGGLQLSTSGIAKAEGRAGEIIAVKNIASSKTIHCRVDGPGSVTVEF